MNLMISLFTNILQMESNQLVDLNSNIWYYNGERICYSGR